MVEGCQVSTRYSPVTNNSTRSPAPPARGCPPVRRTRENPASGANRASSGCHLGRRGLWYVVRHVIQGRRRCRSKLSGRCPEPPPPTGWRSPRHPADRGSEACRVTLGTGRHGRSNRSCRATSLACTQIGFGRTWTADSGRRATPSTTFSNHQPGPVDRAGTDSASATLAAKSGICALVLPDESHKAFPWLRHHILLKLKSRRICPAQ
jgi:hypothetical protein